MDIVTIPKYGYSLPSLYFQMTLPHILTTPLCCCRGVLVMWRYGFYVFGVKVFYGLVYGFRVCGCDFVVATFIVETRFSYNWLRKIQSQSFYLIQRKKEPS